MQDDEVVIAQTKKWIKEVVIGCNFCPFAAREVARNTVGYKVLSGASQKQAVDLLISTCKELQIDSSIETSLLIFPNAFFAFSTYLQLLKAAQRTLAKKGYEGIFQIASFHPEYIFGGSDENDAANFTNRSPYPMLQLLREASVAKAVAAFPQPEKIPQQNIDFSREKGLAFMRALYASCLH